MSRLPSIIIPTAMLVLASGCAFIHPSGRSGRATAEQADNAFRHRRYDEADKAYAQIDVHDPDYQLALTRRGEIAAIRGDVKAAMELLKAAEAVNPTAFGRVGNVTYNEVYAMYLTRAAWDIPEEALRLAGSDKTIVVVSRRMISAYQVEDGRPLWSVPLGEFHDTLTLGPPVIANGAVLVVTRTDRDPALQALDLTTGKARWSRGLGWQHKRFEPVTDGKIVAISAGGGDEPFEIRGVSFETGEVRWSAKLDGTPGRLSLAGGRVFVRTKAGTVHALDAVTGAERWVVSLPPKYNDLAPDLLVPGDGFVYIAASDGTLYALDAGDTRYDRPLARIKWKASDPRAANDFFAPVAVGDVVVAPRPGRVEAFVAATGAARWTWDPDETMDAAREVTAQAKGDLICIDFEGLVALGKDGALRWIFQTRPASDRTLPGFQLSDATPVMLGDDVVVAVSNISHTADSGSGYQIRVLTAAPAIPY